MSVAQFRNASERDRRAERPSGEDVGEQMLPNVNPIRSDQERHSEPDRSCLTAREYVLMLEDMCRRDGE